MAQLLLDLLLQRADDAASSRDTVCPLAVAAATMGRRGRHGFVLCQRCLFLSAAEALQEAKICSQGGAINSPYGPASQLKACQLIVL